MTSRRLALFLSIAFLTAGLPAVPLRAAAPGAPGAVPAAPPAADAAARDEVREQSIYVPYDKLWKVFEQKGRGVFVPYEEFQRLWAAAEEATRRPADAPPPAAFLITEVTGDARVAADVMQVRARVRIELLKKGWHSIPLRLRDAAITRATLAGQPARITATPADGHCLLVHKADDTPEVLDLSIEFARAYEKTPGRNSVRFDAPVAPVSRWDVHVPEAGVDVQVHPMLAATDLPADGGATQAETHVAAFVGAAPEVRIEWTPKAEGAKGLQALVNATVEQEVRVEEGVVRTRSRVAYEISRTQLAEFAVEVPADQKVVNVFDENLREWSVAVSGSVQRVRAQLFEPTRGTQSLLIETEKFGETASVAVPVVRAVGVVRQRGLVVVGMGAGLRAEVTAREGLTQVDRSELPPGLAKASWDFAYRYSAVPYALTIRAEAIQPRIVAETLVEGHLKPEDLSVDVLTVFDVQRAGVFRLGLFLPAGYDLRDVTGVGAGGAAAAAVEGHHLDDAAPDGTRKLTVNLARKAMGRVGVGVKLYRRLQEPDLLNPTGHAAQIAIPVPRVDRQFVERESGRLVVYAPESLHVNPADAKGLRVVAYGEAVAGLRSTQSGGSERPVLAFAFADEPASLTVAAERRSPYVSVYQLLAARVEAGVVKYEATFGCDVIYSGVRSLRLDVPTNLASRIRLQTQGVRYAVLTGADAPADVEPGCVAWRLSGETEFLGHTDLRFTWEEKLQKLDIGRSVSIAVPRLSPRDVDRAWGQIVLAKTEEVDVMPDGEPVGLNPIDPRTDLQPGRTVADAARAFEFHDAWSLKVNATRYELEEVKSTSIERGLVRMVVTRGDVVSVQAVYRMRSARQRLIIRLPGEVAFDTQPVRLDGRPVPLERGEKGDYFVPLSADTTDRPFLLEIRYALRGTGLDLRAPEFPFEPAVQHVYHSVYVPREWTYLGFAGPWNDELVWVLKGFSSHPRANRTGDWLLNWVREGAAGELSGLQSFATDGSHLLYSTLRPGSGAGGALRVRMMRSWLFQFLVLALIGVGGLALLPARFACRAWAVGLGLMACVLLGVFSPSLARSLCNNGAVGAVALVAIVWTLWYLVVTRPRDPEVLRRKAARAEARLRRSAPPPPAAAAPGAEGGSHG